MNVLEVRDVSFAYGSVRVLEHAALTADEGRFVWLTGTNGSGKTTLMKLILKKLPLRQGEIRLFGTELSDFDRWTDVGYLPQSVSALTEGFPATAGEIVALGLWPRRREFRFRRDRERAAVLDALAAVGMEEFVDRPVGGLSGGQRQRVMLARVLAGRPRLLLLDEPSGGVDPENTEALYRLVRQICAREGRTALMITHDVRLAPTYADDIYCLEHGNLLRISKEQLESELSHRHRHGPYGDGTVEGGAGV